MSEDESPINAVLNSGRTVPCHSCNCGGCGNEWFVPGYSDEWMPNYCPYCGMKFIRREMDGTPADYRPNGDPSSSTRPR